MMNIKKILAVGAFIMATAFIAAGCGKRDTDEVRTFIDISDDGKTVTANFDRTDAGTGGGTGVTIEEGESLVVDRDLTDGSVHVKVVSTTSDISYDIMADDDEAVIDSSFDSEGTYQIESIEPGDYMIQVMVEDKATGTINFYIAK